MADIAGMISVTCRSCGSDLEDPEDVVCMHCGLPVGSSRRAETTPEPQPEVQQGTDATSDPAPMLLSSQSLWRLAIWGALVVSTVAAGAFAATLLTAVFRTPEPEAAAAGTASASTTTVPADQTIGSSTPSFDPPVSGTVAIANPKIDQLTRHHIGDEIVTFQIDGTFCGSADGSIMASGTVHNYSMAQQTFDYEISVELIRTWNRARIGQLETTVEDLAPFESAEWSVEMVSSRVSAFDCAVTQITATPAG